MTTRRGRSGWLAAMIAAAAGLLLSLVVVLSESNARPPSAPQVRGAAAVDTYADSVAPAAVAGVELLREGASPVVGRSSAALEPSRESRRALPAGVRLPSLDLRLDVRQTGVARDGQMALPADPSVLGWYRHGPAPRDRGSVVMAGHVDSRRFGVGPLARLSELAPGDLVEVRDRRGRLRTYRVDSLERFERTALPAEVFSRTGPERLRLVTCTGPFLPEAGGYQQNLVVTALPVRRG